jgi:secreted trypsin-like serine protease
LCGGSLLASDLVLTAAHCAGHFDAIQFNRYQLSNDREDVETFLPIQEFLHPDHDANSYSYDLVIVKLNGIVSLIDPIRPNDNTELPEDRDRLTVLGWGLTVLTDDYDAYADILQQVEVEYIPNDACKAITDANGTSISEYILPDMICARDEGKDACYGDSGSPLIAKGGTPQEDVQIGIVSWGEDCAGVFPGIYHRLSYSYEWIRETSCLHAQDAPPYFGCYPTEMPTTAQPAPSLLPSSQLSENDNEGTSKVSVQSTPNENSPVSANSKPYMGAVGCMTLGFGVIQSL